MCLSLLVLPILYKTNETVHSIEHRGFWGISSCLKCVKVKSIVYIVHIKMDSFYCGTHPPTAQSYGKQRDSHCQKVGRKSNNVTAAIIHIPAL